MKNLIFDMDGVIFDTEALVLVCWEEVGREYGLTDLQLIAKECIGNNAVVTKEKIVSYYLPQEIPYDEIKERRSVITRQKIDENGMPMKPGIYELMDYLKADGWKVGLATSTGREAVEYELRLCGLLDKFDVIVCGDQVKRSKPEPDIFLKCAELLGCAPAETYVVEDSFNGIRAAHAAGMKPIMVPDLLIPDEEIRSLCYRVLPDLLEVRDLLRTENN